MAKRRERSIDNPLRLDHVEAIASSSRRQADAATESVRDEQRSDAQEAREPAAASQQEPLDTDQLKSTTPSDELPREPSNGVAPPVAHPVPSPGGPSPTNQSAAGAGPPARPPVDSPRRPPRPGPAHLRGRQEWGGGPPARPQPAPKDTHQIKTRFSEQEAEAIEAFRVSLEQRLGVKLRQSQITRALWTIMLRAEDDLDGVRAPELERPSYGDVWGMAAFEDAIAGYLHAAIKRAKRTE